ncbi:MAG TPA: hypothetical protein VGI13_07840 [Candidatus Acidoferrum sp.]
MSAYIKELQAKLKPLPKNWKHLNKMELAIARLPEEWRSSFDVALPQPWLDQQAAGDDEVYGKILSRTVWFYPPKCIGGFALNLVEGRIWI